MTRGLTVNGEERRYGAADFPASVGDLVARLGLDPARVAAEVNGGIVRRESFAGHALADGDRVELVRFVGGG